MAGHGRLEAAKLLGIRQVPTIRIGDLTEAQKRAYVIADAAGREKEAIEKWQVIANLAEGTDNDLAARALFSVGYLLQGEDLKRSISVYNEAILLKPDLYEGDY